MRGVTRPFKTAQAALAILILMSAAGTAVASEVSNLADRYVALQLEIDPLLADRSGLSGPRDILPDISPAALQRRSDAQDALWREVSSADLIPASESERRTLAILTEALRNDVGVRVCRSELWSPNHIFGWQAIFPQIASSQMMEGAQDRDAAFKRWSALPLYLEQDRANLATGLKLGYSAPKSVVRRVIAQLDALLAQRPEASPFASAGERAADPAFQRQMTELTREHLYPAMRAYRAYLADEYLVQAREAVAVSTLPNGRACYEASLRYFTTLPITPEQVYAAGEGTVARNLAEIGVIGQRRFGTADLGKITAKIAAAPENRFGSSEEVLAYSRARLAKNEAITRPAIADYPRQGVIIAPFEGRGAPLPHYEPEPDPAKPGRYVLPLNDWKKITRSQAEWLVVHEAVPGHHVQLSTMFQRHIGEAIDKVAVNAAFTEGWARYSETLAEELGIYESDFAKVERRAWPGRGQVLDVGVHVGGWTREQATDYLKSTGLYDDDDAAAMLDRIAVVPGQLTAYDTGAAEFFALRAEAEVRLGPNFDEARFHTTLLEQGAVPLVESRGHVRSWIEAEARRTSSSADR